MVYQLQFINGDDFPHPLGKIICVGRNYAEHAKELNNPVPTSPVLFIKPSTAAVCMEQPFTIPEQQGRCDHELEMTVLIAQPLKNASLEQAKAAIAGLGMGLDLTLREVQEGLKQKAHPWERAKAFDGSCPMSKFVAYDGRNLQTIELELWRNDHLQQRGNSQDMLFPVLELLVEISENFTLLPGDVVLTGTPAGVGPLYRGDKLKARLDDLLSVETEVC
jgi:2-keto-4-pentenoate hydratase/2-oxohepta-3-ene-1,7-dioic acid hydratase in catechol pathway